MFDYTNASVFDRSPDSIFDLLHTIYDQKIFLEKKVDVSIPFPIIEMLDSHTFSTVEAMIVNMGIGERIVFEINESEYGEYQEQIEPLIRKLKDIGARFASNIF